MHYTAASNAFARWETLDPPAVSSSTEPPWGSLSTPSLRSKVPPPPDQKYRLQPPPTPNVGSTDRRSGSFAVGGGGTFSMPSPHPRRDESRITNPLAERAVFRSSDGIAGSRDTGSRVSTSIVDSRAVGKAGATSPPGSAPFSRVDVDNNRAKTPAALTAVAHVGAAAGPPSSPQPEARRSPAAVRGRNMEGGPLSFVEPARSSGGGGGGGGIIGGRSWTGGSGSGSRSGSGGAGGYGLAKTDTESLLARLAGKAKQAAAVALSASAASGGITRPPPSTPTPLSTPHHRKAVVRPEATGPFAPGTRGRASMEVDSNSDAVRERRSGVWSCLGADVGRGNGGEGFRDEHVAPVAGGQGPETETAAAAAAVAVAGGARLAELCKEDKTKVARLMQDLVKLRAEKDGQKARFERLRAQNDSIVKEMARLKVKFGQSMQLLRKYQNIVQETTAAGIGVIGTAGATNASTRSTEGDAPTMAAEMQALRETVRVAEESSRRAETEAAAERASRAAIAEELQRARQQADGLRQQLDHHHRLETEAAHATAAREGGAGQGLDFHGVVRRGGIPSVSTVPEQTAMPLAAAQSHRVTVRTAVDAAPALALAPAPSRVTADHGGPLPGTVVKDDVGETSARIRARLATTDIPSVLPSSEGPAESTAPGRTARPGGDIKGGVAEVVGGSSDTFPATVSVGAAAAARGSPGSEGRVEGVASNDELAAVKAQVGALKQQLVMVGVQQLALTGIPTGAALVNEQGEGLPHPFHDPAAAAAAAATVRPLAVDGHLNPASAEAGRGGDGGRVPGSMAADVLLWAAQMESDDRRGSVSAQQQHQQPPARRAGAGSVPRGREAASARGEQAGGSGEAMLVGAVRRRRKHDERKGRWSDADEGCVLIEESEGEKGVSGDGELAARDASANDEKRVDWSARSAGKPLLAPGDTAGQEDRRGDDQSGRHGRPSGSSRRDGAGISSIAGTSVARGDRSCDGETFWNPESGGPRGGPVPRAPAIKSAGVRAGHAPSPRGKSCSHHHGTSLASAADGALDAAPGRGKLRVSWSSISVRSSASDLSRESVAASSAASTSNRSSGSSGASGGRSSSWRRRSDGTDAVLPEPQQGHRRQRQERRQQQQQQQQQQPHDGASPSTFSSSFLSSSVHGRQERRAATDNSGVGVGVSLGVAAPDRGHCSGSTSGGALPTVGKYHPRLKTRASAVPGSRRRVMPPASIAGGGTTTSTVKPADCAGDTAAVVHRPAAIAVYKETTSASSRYGKHNSYRRVGAAAATGDDSFRESDCYDSSSSSRSVVPAGKLASSCLQCGVAEKGWKATVPPDRARRTLLGRVEGMGKAVHVGLGRSSSGEGWGGSWTPETRWNRGLEAMLSDDDTTEALATLGGERFFDCSLLDLIDDLEESNSPTVASRGPEAPARNIAAASAASAAASAAVAAAALAEVASPRRRSREVPQSKSWRVLREGGGGVGDVAAETSYGGGGWRSGGAGAAGGGGLGGDSRSPSWRYGEEDEEGDY